MLASISSFLPKHNFLICFDSDGTVMDTMGVKHEKCLFPSLIEEWGLQALEPQIRSLWYDINLYRSTRGVNRFIALSMALVEIDRSLTPIDGVKLLDAWVQSGSPLSGDALKVMEQREQEKMPPILRKALHWTEMVNARIAALPLSDKKPFSGTQEGIAAAKKFADIAVITTANRAALLQEWGE